MASVMQRFVFAVASLSFQVLCSAIVAGHGDLLLVLHLFLTFPSRAWPCLSGNVSFLLRIYLVQLDAELGYAPPHISLQFYSLSIGFRVSSLWRGKDKAKESKWRKSRGGSSTQSRTRESGQTGASEPQEKKQRWKKIQIRGYEKRTQKEQHKPRLLIV